jgi:phosphotriesterase-related protein
MHEHVFVQSIEMQLNYPDDWGDEDTRVVDAAKRLPELKASGIDTIVDLTVVGLGRFIPRIAHVAQMVDLNIVVATGYYTFDRLPGFFLHRSPTSSPSGGDPLVDMFVNDLTIGIARTGVRAGILKCATDLPGATPDVERVLRAVARAHRDTGAPITTHAHAGSRRGIEQQRIFHSEGVDLTRVIIGHSGDTTDLDYHLELLDNGSYLGMDRFGLDTYLGSAARVQAVAELCRRGYASQLVLSHDAACYVDAFPPNVRAEQFPNWNYFHISRDVLPALTEAGVSDANIELMLVDNPRRTFEHQGAY